MVLPLAVRLLKRWMPGKLEFPRNHLLREGKGQNLVPVSHLISWKEISHRSGNLSDHLAEQARDTYDVQEHSLIIYTFSPLAKGKPQGRTLKMDSGSLALCSSLDVASQNQYPFPDFMSLVCSMGLVRTCSQASLLTRAWSPTLKVTEIRLTSRQIRILPS